MLGAFSEALHEGPGHHRKLSDLCAEALKSWRTLAASDPELTELVRFDGALLLAHDDADAARVKRAADRAKRHGAPFALFDGLPPDLDARIFGAKVKLAARFSSEGAAMPAPTLARLAEMAISFGASLVRGRAVSDLVAEAGRVTGVMLDDGGILPADIVVLAPGAPSPSALADIAPALSRVSPVKGMLGIAPAPDALRTTEIVRTTRSYFWREDDKILFGATSEPGRADLDDDPQAIAALYLEVRRSLPGARFPGAPETLSAGIRPMTPDGAPIVGRDGPDGCIVATGHARNGWLLAPVTAHAVAALCAGGEPAPVWRDFGPGRFA
jgi:glycine oxidase